MSDDISIPSPTYRVPRHRGIDPATRRLALIAAGMAGVVVLVISGWSLLGGGPRTVPVVEPQSGPMRVKPANPGGLQVQGVRNDIFSGGSDTGVDKLAPPPEVPDPQALRAPPPPAAPAVPAPAPSAPAAGLAPTAQAQGAALPLPLPPAVVPPAPTMQPVQASSAPSRPAPVAVATRQPEHPPVAAGPAESAGVAGGSKVQLAALSTEQAARLEWRDLSRRIPGLLAGRQPMFTRVEHAGHVFWRVRTGGFADQAAARAFCQRVRAKGLACSVADF